MGDWKLGTLMVNDKQQEWHRDEHSDDGDLTLRHPGIHFQTFRTWAEQHNVSDIFDAIALTFGFTENFTVVGNLSSDLASQDAQAVLNQWADNPYINELTRLLRAFSQDSVFANAYPGITHGTSRNVTKSILRKAGADLKNGHFLLEMIVQSQPLSDKRTLDRPRTSLKIWLIVQALERVVESNCSHDTQIQQVASTLCLPGDNLKWLLVDQLLERALKSCPSDKYTYSQFTLAVRHAAAQLAPSYSPLQTRKEQLILKAIQRVAEGQINPAKGQRSGNALQISFENLRKTTGSVFDLGRLTEGPQVLAYSNSEIGSADEDSLDQLLLFGVDPREVPEQQKLTGRSILMHTAELSNYLPWSWDKPLPPETHALERWLTRTLVDENLTEKLGAALIWLAVHLERSLEFIQEIEITNDTHEEWSVSRDLLTAHRERPKRHSAWFPDSEATSLVEAFEGILSVTLPEQVQSILREAVHLFPANPTLRDLWTKTCHYGLTAWFRQHSKQHFPRLTSAKLANVQSQRVFDETGDHSLARILSAHPRAALPAACGYANWDIEQVQNGFGLAMPESAFNGKRINLLGSLLAPLESVLVDGIRDATEKLLEDSKGGLVTFHNTLAQYTATALSAATGCRYLSEPFENLAHFCEQPPAVFINDKSDDGLHCGRMVPLAPGAVTLLRNYCEHLRRLKSALADEYNDLRQRIEQVLQGSSETLPFFFLLDNHGAWHPLNDLNVPGADLFSGPLPKNLFRHRFSQQLARTGVHPEVIDGWMGHGERGTTSYSDHSARCWRDDYERYKGILEDCFDRLGFLLSLPETNYDVITFRKAKLVGDAYREPEHFGQARRHAARLKARDAAYSVASRELNLMLEAKQITEEAGLDQAIINDLVKKMIFRENGMPHSQASVRMEILVQWLEDKSPHARQFIRHRVTRLGLERSLVRDTCPIALQAMPQLRQWVQDAKDAIRQTRLSKSDGLAMAAAFVAIEKRISYLGLLNDLVQGQNYRVIQHNHHVYLEYSECLEADNYDQPVQRHQIDHTTARLLARGVGIKNSKDLETTYCPGSLQSLANMLVPTGHLNEEEGRWPLAALLKALSRLIEQANLIDFPGMVAGALSERNPPTSLCLYDYFRLTEGQRYESPATDQLPSIPEAESLPAIPVSTSGTYPEAFYDSAKDFLRAIQDILNQYTKHKSRDIAEKIEKHCRANTHSVSSAVLLLGYWAAYRIRKGKGRANRAHKAYAAGSIKRYLSALSGAFRGFACKVDLLMMTEEEVTELCAQMLSYHAENLKDLEYFSARLLDFFGWASERGVSSPDWDELDLGSSRRSVRPRLFSEEEYLEALQLLLRHDVDDIDRGMQAAFALLLGFRFGLRAQEALGLLRSDWCESAGLVWVLVQNNSIRTLKSSVHSRRAVPLLFQLTDTEQTLVATIVARYAAWFGKDLSKPLLAGRDGRLRSFAGSLPSDIARALKVVTGNSLMSLHQARHAFCNLLSCVLFNLGTPLAQKLAQSVNKESLRRVLLGNQGLVSRRSPMAIARALGHQSPRTQLRSYNRMLTDWADSLTPVSSHYVSTISNAEQVDQWRVKSSTRVGTGTQIIFARKAALKPLTVVEALRLMALGYSVHRIEELLCLSSGDLVDVEVMVDRVNFGLRFKMYDPEQAKNAYVYGSSLPKYLLKSRPITVWSRLMKLCERLPVCEEFDSDRPLPSLANASNLVGRNGHLLMKEVEDVHLMRLLVDAFSIHDSSYKIGVKGRPDQTAWIHDVIRAVGFVPTDSSLQLDTFNVDFDSAYTRARAYAGLVLTTPVTGQILDRLDLVMLFVAFASAYCPRPEPLSPVPQSRAHH